MKLKTTMLVVLLLIAACSSGCVDSDKKVHTYRCTVDNGTLYLSGDGTYELLIDESMGGGGIYGNYSIRDHAVLLKRAFIGDILVLKQDGRDLIDWDGDRWTRD
ncbi:MAG: hypothetical protein OCU18_08500 [Candidatus Syntrophoarchaeum sp.]|nr:hypothetical protein [Candidatus Syntrophoarchaeum sp.]